MIAGAFIAIIVAAIIDNAFNAALALAGYLLLKFFIFDLIDVI